MTTVIIMFIILLLVITLQNVVIGHRDAFLDFSPQLLKPIANCLEYAKNTGYIDIDNDNIDNDSRNRINILSDMELLEGKGRFLNHAYFTTEPVCVLPRESFPLYRTRGGRNGINPKTCQLKGRTAYGNPVNVNLTPLAEGCGLPLGSGGKPLLDILDNLHEIKTYDETKRKLDDEARLKKTLLPTAPATQHKGRVCRMARTSDFGKNTGQPMLRRFANLPLSCERGEVITRIMPPDLEGISYECCKIDAAGLTKENITNHTTGWFDPLNWRNTSLLQHRIECGGTGGLQQFYIEAKDEGATPIDVPQARINYTCAHLRDNKRARCDKKPKTTQAWGEIRCTKGHINQILPSASGSADIQFDYKCCRPRK
jgi:hypothetical protein